LLNVKCARSEAALDKRLTHFFNCFGNIHHTHTAEEESNLRIRFYDGFYEESFGSIFPTVDIVSLVPDNEADVAILEEPEHLNWFRVPSSSSSSPAGNTPGASAADDDDEQDSGRLGWAHKFRHSVGVLHTNYDAYLRQYAGMGTSVVAAPALNGLSSLVVRAYCRRVIRLSDALPSLDAKKEVTCNVHGVRQEFFDRSSEHERQKHPNGDADADSIACNQKVYFIGKLIWAKGFGDVLQLQEKVKEASGEYFGMEIYGGGKDQDSIQRSFLGRKRTEETNRDGLAEADRQASEIFCDAKSLRELVCGGFSDVGADGRTDASHGDEGENTNSLFRIVGELSGDALGVGAETADAAFKLLQTSLRAVFDSSLRAVFDSSKENHAAKDKDSYPEKFLPIIPRQAQYKWRREPIPARFMGVVDHIALRDVPERSIFLNMSKSEVLCTTTAEALAMGKFVIIPKHRTCVC